MNINSFKIFGFLTDHLAEDSLFLRVKQGDFRGSPKQLHCSMPTEGKGLLSVTLFGVALETGGKMGSYHLSSED